MTKKHTEATLKERLSVNLSIQMKLGRWTNSNLAEVVGMDRTDIWRYKTGKSWPTAERYASICSALDVEPSYLLRSVREEREYV